MCALLSEDAVAFALTLVGAHAAADGGEIAAQVDYGHGIAEISHRQFVNPCGDVVADGTALAALGHLAPQASLGFADSLRHCVVFVFHYIC